MTINREMPAAQPQNGAVYMYVGSWHRTLGGDDGGGGITAFAVNPVDGSLMVVGDYAAEMSVGSISVARGRRSLYAANETKFHSGTGSLGGSVSAFEIDPLTGGLRRLNSQPTMGAFPCSISIDSNERFLAVANYGSQDRILQSTRNPDGTFELLAVPDEASIALLPLAPDGKLGTVADLARHSSFSGIDPVWQIGPHPHAVVFDPHSDYAIACDRGSDALTVYRLVASGSRWEGVGEIQVVPGAGPRSLKFNERTGNFYVSNEMVPTVAAYNLDRATGRVEALGISRTTPPNYRPRDPNDFFACTHPSDLAVHPSGEFVYVLNRGHNSVARFTADARGRLRFEGTTPSEGTAPWAIGIDPSGRFLYVGNQESGTIVSFEVKGETGDLTPTGFVAYARKPAAIAFAAVTDG